MKSKPTLRIDCNDVLNELFGSMSQQQIDELVDTINQQGEGGENVELKVLGNRPLEEFSSRKKSIRGSKNG